MKRVMVDIETLSTKPAAAVIAIGACVFDETSIGAKFEVLVCPVRALRYGDEDEETLSWWAGQPARERMFSGVKSPPIAAREFRHWMLDVGPVGEVWANGPQFDLVVLEHWFETTCVHCPWTYDRGRDLRTLKRLADELGIRYDVPDTYQAHDALQDALRQAAEWQRIMRGLRAQRAAA